MVGVEGRRRRIGWEEFDVQRVLVVDWDHGFAVIIQIFEQDFAESVYLPRIRVSAISTEELTLFFEGAEEGV